MDPNLRDDKIRTRKRTPSGQATPSIPLPPNPLTILQAMMSGGATETDVTQDDIDARKIQLADSKAKVGQMTTELSVERRNRTVLQETIQSKEREFIDKQDALNVMERDLANVQTTIGQLQAETNQFNVQSSQMNLQLPGMRQNIGTLSEQIQSLEAALPGCLDEKNNTARELAGMNQELAGIETEISSVEAELAAAEQELQQIEVTTGIGPPTGFAPPTSPGGSGGFAPGGF